MLLCQKQIKQQHEKDKLIYANMFQKFAERDSKVKSVGVFLKKPPFKRWTWLMGLYFLFFFLQKEELKGKTDSKENGGEKMETERSEEKGSSEEKA